MENTISTTPVKAFKRPHRVVRHHDSSLLYRYPEDFLSPILYVLERKKARTLGIPLRPDDERPNAQRMNGYVWAPGK
jgi:hypothetical protein